MKQKFNIDWSQSDTSKVVLLCLDLIQVLFSLIKLVGYLLDKGLSPASLKLEMN